MTKKLPSTLDTVKKQRRIRRLLQAYVEECRAGASADGKKQSTPLPNLAGFCRYLGCGVARLESLCTDAPMLYDWICATLEDELITQYPSPSLLAYYLKKRLGYDGQDKAGAEACCGEVRLVFDHDIVEDGA